MADSDASGTLILVAPTLTGSATYTPVSLASGALSLPAVSCTATASYIWPLQVSGSLAVPAVRVNVGQLTYIPPAGLALIFASGTPRLPVPRVSGSLTNAAFSQVSGTPTLPVPTFAGEATVGAAPRISGTPSLPVIQLAGEAVSGPPPVGTGTWTLPAVSAEGFGIARVFSFDVFARRPIAVDQPPLASSNYPFLRSSPDAVIGDIVADLAILLPPEVACQTTLPLRVAWLGGFGTQSVAKPVGVPNVRNNYDVLIKDANGNTVFNSTLTGTVFRTAAWGTRLEVTEWRQADRVLRVVHNVAWVDNNNITNYPIHIVPVGNTDLDPRTTHFKPAFLESIVADGQTLRGDVILEEGYNTSITVGTPIPFPSGLSLTPITINSIPGAGLGTYGSCADSLPETTGPIDLSARGFLTIGGVAGDEKGNFRFNGSECFRIERTEVGRSIVSGVPTVGIGPGLTFHMDCQPCCSCDNHVRVYKAIKRLWDRARVLADRAVEIRDLHQANIDRWTEQASCRSADKLRVIMVPWCSGSVSIAASYCNNQDVCLGNLDMEFCFNLTNSGDGALEVNPERDMKIPCGTGFSETTYLDPGAYTLGGEWPCFTAQFSQIEPLSSAAVRFQINIAAAKLGNSASLSLTVKAGTQTQTVECQLIRGRP